MIAFALVRIALRVDMIATVIASQAIANATDALAAAQYVAVSRREEAKKWRSTLN